MHAMSPFLAWRYKRFHMSYVLGWGCTGLLFGLGLAAVWHVPFSLAVYVSIGLVVLGALRRRRWWSVVVVVMCGALFGLGRGADMKLALRPYTEHVGQVVRVSGVISDDPQYGSRGDQQFRLTRITVNDRELPGDMFVGTYSFLDVKRGDRVVLKGKLRDGFGSYQASLGFATLEEAVAMHDPVREFRDRFAAGVRNAVEEPSASLGIGFVVGQRSALPEDLDDQLRAVGLTHIVVASGYNLTILVRFARRLLEKHSKYLATAVSGGLMAGFVAVSGLSPSMTRASLVTGLSLLAWYYGRRFHPLLLIVYTAALTACINPIFIWSDIGWYLSFLAFGGVLMLAPLLSRLIFRQREASAIAQIVIETIAAQIMTLPLILMIFGQLPLLSVLANALVAPVIPLSMLLTTIAGVWGMVWPAAAGFAGAGAEIVMGYIIAIVRWLAEPSWTQVALKLQPATMIVLYVAITGMMVGLWRKLRYNFRSSSVVE